MQQMLTATKEQSLSKKPTLVHGSAILRIPGSTNQVFWDVQALDGGVIDMPLLASILVRDNANGNARIASMKADNIGSTVTLDDLNIWDDQDGTQPSLISQTNMGQVIYPDTAIFINVTISR